MPHREQVTSEMRPGRVCYHTMNATNWTVVFAQLAGQSPILLVYLIGMVLCAVWWRRAPRAARYAMIGCGILLLTNNTISFVQVY